MSNWLDEPPTAPPTEPAPAPAPAPAEPKRIYPNSVTWVHEWLYLYSPKPPVWCFQ